MWNEQIYNPPNKLNSRKGFRKPNKLRQSSFKFYISNCQRHRIASRWIYLFNKYELHTCPMPIPLLTTGDTKMNADRVLPHENSGEGSDIYINTFWYGHWDIHLCKYSCIKWVEAIMMHRAPIKSQQMRN